MGENNYSFDNLPVYFRIGSIGAGLGVGCGVGIGFGQPLNLGAVPGMGQAMAGMSNGLGQVSGLVGGAGTGAREAVRRLGVKGLDAGIGCGVGVGYGFGAGLFLKPSAAEQFVRLVENAAGNLMCHAQARLQEVGIHLPHGPPQPTPPSSQPSLTLQPAPTAGLQAAPSPPYYPHTVAPHHQPYSGAPSPAPPLYTAAGAPQAPPGFPLTALLPPSLTGLHGAGLLGQPPRPSYTAQPSLEQPQEHDAHSGGSGAAAGAPGAASSSSSFPSSSSPSSMASGEPSTEEFRALLRHEREILRLKAQNRALRRAVCKLDRRLPVCKEPSDDDGGANGLG